MQLLAADGRSSEALRQYQEMERLLDIALLSVRQHVRCWRSLSQREVQQTLHLLILPEGFGRPTVGSQKLHKAQVKLFPERIGGNGTARIVQSLIVAARLHKMRQQALYGAAKLLREPLLLRYDPLLVVTASSSPR